MIDFLKTLAICSVLYAGFSHARLSNDEREQRFQKWYFGRPKNDTVETVTSASQERTRTVQTYSAGDVVLIVCRTGSAYIDIGTDPNAQTKTNMLTFGIGALFEVKDDASYIETYPVSGAQLPSCYISEKII